MHGTMNIKDRQYMYNVNTEARSSKKWLQWKKQHVLHILSVRVCSLRYPVRNAIAPYCHLLPVRLYSIFLTLSHKGHDLKKKITKYKVCFSLQLLSEIFLIRIRNEREK